MKKKLVRENQKIQSYFMLFFVIFASVLLMAVFCNYSFTASCETLQSMTTQITGFIQQISCKFQVTSINFESIHSSLTPMVQSMIQSHPKQFFAGFYVLEMNRIVAMAGNAKHENELFTDESRRYAWKIGKSLFSLYYSRPQRCLILKCEQPVRYDNVVIGYSFAGLCTACLIKKNIKFALTVLGILSLLCFIFYLSGRKMNRKISKCNENNSDSSKRTERYLQEIFRSISVILDNIYDGFMILDKDGHIIYINQKAVHLLSLGEEVHHKKIWDILPELKGTRIYEQYLKTLSEQVSVIFESQWRSNGRWYEHRVYPSHEGIIVFISDITERKEAELMVTAERELLATVLASVEEGVIATDLHGKVLMISHRAEKLTGWTAEEVEKKDLSQWFYVMDDQSSESYDDLINNSLSTRQPIIIDNAVLVTKNLNEVQIRLYCAPLINPMDQQVIGTVFVFEDVTQKKLLQETLQKTEKYESLAVLAGGIAHDFNNYLTAILSNIQLTKLLLAKGKRVDRHLDQVIDVSLKASELTRQLLTFSKGGAPVKRLGSIAQLIEDIVNFNLRGSKVKCIFNIEENLWNAEFDPGQISQVITNLTLNAKQAMADGGILRVSAKNVVITDKLLYKPGNYLKLVFKDQGPGIPPDIVDKVFDPFFTTKPDGSGLGLALSYSIIRKHDGYIEVDSVPGEGCEFTIYLPASQNQLEREHGNAETYQEPIIQGHILLMDDEEMIRNVMAESLRYMGYSVTTTKDGMETVERYRQAMEENRPFDIVILDLTIPGGMGGLETIEQLLKVDPHVKAVISSGYATGPVISGFREFGFAGYVSKPYRLDELSDVLQRLLRNASSNSEVS